MQYCDHEKKRAAKSQHAQEFLSGFHPDARIRQDITINRAVAINSKKQIPHL